MRDARRHCTGIVRCRLEPYYFLPISGSIFGATKMATMVSRSCAMLLGLDAEGEIGNIEVPGVAFEV